MASTAGRTARGADDSDDSGDDDKQRKSSKLPSGYCNSKGEPLTEQQLEALMVFDAQLYARTANPGDVMKYFGFPPMDPSPNPQRWPSSVFRPEARAIIMARLLESGKLKIFNPNDQLINSDNDEEDEE